MITQINTTNRYPNPTKLNGAFKYSFSTTQMDVRPMMKGCYDADRERRIGDKLITRKVKHCALKSDQT